MNGFADRNIPSFAGERLWVMVESSFASPKTLYDCLSQAVTGMGQARRLTIGQSAAAE